MPRFFLARLRVTLQTITFMVGRNITQPAGVILRTPMQYYTHVILLK